MRGVPVARDARTGILLFLVLFTVTGILYPLGITIFGQLFFPYTAGGSLVTDPGGTVRGSVLVGQEFTGTGYFVGRPSATSGSPYNSSASGGSNLGPTNPALLSRVDDRIAYLTQRQIPPPYVSDIVFSSASGLDPHITVSAAMSQVPMIARERNMAEEDLRTLVTAHAEQGILLFSQEPYVNVLLLNHDLDYGFSGRR